MGNASDGKQVDTAYNIADHRTPHGTLHFGTERDQAGGRKEIFCLRKKYVFPLCNSPPQKVPAKRPPRE